MSRLEGFSEGPPAPPILVLLVICAFFKATQWYSFIATTATRTTATRLYSTGFSSTGCIKTLDVAKAICSSLVHSRQTNLRVPCSLVSSCVTSEKETHTIEVWVVPLREYGLKSERRARRPRPRYATTTLTSDLSLIHISEPTRPY